MSQIVNHLDKLGMGAKPAVIAAGKGAFSLLFALAWCWFSGIVGAAPAPPVPIATSALRAPRASDGGLAVLGRAAHRM